MTLPRTSVARAFAPGHLTGVFRPEAGDRDPRARGSVGAGIVLELGAWAEARFTRGGRSILRVEGDGRDSWPISEDVARRLRPDAPGTLVVRLKHELPVGQGFGMSAAGALATALALASISGTPRSQAVQVAHLADLFGGGGLGGVAAILGGGLEVRRQPGVPPYGQVVHRAFRSALLVGVVGPTIPSPSVLRSRAALRRITKASHGWERLVKGPTTRTFFEVSERFTDRSGLASPRVTRTIAALRQRGAYACQAMFGQSFFALPRSTASRTACLEWLANEGDPTVEIRASTRGAHLVRLRSS